ncbi:MAG: formylglycine-generating enzyme family protein [Armatimonadota bacterium]
MNARWFFSSRWRRTWFALGVLVLLIATAAFARWLAVERHIAALMEAEYAPPPEGMVFVPAGYFWLGSDSPDADGDVPALQRVFLPAFYIGEHEVTNAEFAEVFPDHEYPDGEGNMPVTAVLRPQALEYCERLGGYLPTGAEWEKAARGTDGRQWPWGNEFRPECANIGRLDAAALERLEQRGIDCAVLGPRVKMEVGSYPCGASPYGAMDMAGNVWEWVSDIHVDPRPPLDLRWRPIERGVIRGGAYGYGPDAARTWYQAFEDPKATCNDVGFRMAMRAEPLS